MEVTVNCDGQTCCAMNSLLEVMDLKPTSGLSRAPDTTLSLAASHVEERVLREAQPFWDRMEKRLERDRHRLHEHYRALLRDVPRRVTAGVTLPGR